MLRGKMSGSLFEKLVRHKIEFLSAQRQELLVLQKYNLKDNSLQSIYGKTLSTNYVISTLYEIVA